MSEKNPMYHKYIEIARSRALKEAKRREAGKYDTPLALDKTHVGFTLEAWDKAHEIQKECFSGVERYEGFNRTIHFAVEFTYQIMFKNDEIVNEASRSLLEESTEDIRKAV